MKNNKNKLFSIFCLFFISGVAGIGTFSVAQFKFKGEVISAGSNINSAYDEQNPVISPNGSVLYFTRVKHPGNTDGKRDPGDIWFSVKDQNGNWQSAQNAGPTWNDKGYNAIIGFTNNGKTVYLNGHYDPDGKRSVNDGISISHRTNNQWSFPQPVEVKYFKKNSDHQNSSLSADGQVIVFSLESYESRGAEDIYVSFKRHDGTFTDIQNLGSVINTPFQEMTPALLADNSILVFASNGHGGNGSFDLFFSRRLDESWKNWTQPENLGGPVNSNGRELYYFPDPTNSRIYFCSTRNSDGYGDVKTILIEPDSLMNHIIVQNETPADTAFNLVQEKQKFTISGMVLSSKNNQPVSGIISIYLSNKSPLGEIQTAPDGSFLLELSSRSAFLIKISAKGYMNIEESLDIENLNESALHKDYFLEPLETGRIFHLDNVLFQQSTAELIDSSYAQLNLVSEMLTENPEVKIEISGHTDNVGDSRKNIELSEQRVEMVKDYLVSKGINPSRITGKGYGGMKPVASNATESTRRLNRRVEFRIIK
jgi:OOP family OmpA-OmpF porin